MDVSDTICMNIIIIGCICFVVHSMVNLDKLTFIQGLFMSADQISDPAKEDDVYVI
jgi:hypothetical protein